MTTILLKVMLLIQRTLFFPVPLSNAGHTTQPNSDGLINWLRQPGLLLNQPQKSMRVNINPLIKFCCTRTDPAAETKSIGLPAGALAVMVFASPLRQFYRDVTTRGRLPGFSRQDNFIVT